MAVMTTEGRRSAESPSPGLRLKRFGLGRKDLGRLGNSRSTTSEQRRLKDQHVVLTISYTEMVGDKRFIHQADGNNFLKTGVV